MQLYNLATCEQQDCDNVVLALKSGFVPSVTSILSIIRQEHLELCLIRKSIERYQQTSDLAEACEYRDTRESDFKTVCHALMEAHLLATPCHASYDDRHQRAVQPLFKWIDKNVAEVILCRRSFANEALGYGGMADLLFRLNDSRLLLASVDYKRNGKYFPMTSDRTCRYELSAHRKMFEPRYGEMDIANFLLASPFRPAWSPLLRVNDFGKRDWFDGFNAARHLWLEQFIG